MAISAREVNNKRDSLGRLTGKSGVVYDVNLKYHTPDGQKSYMKRGFLTKKEASIHEAEMKIELQNQAVANVSVAKSNQKLCDYLEDWLDNYVKHNLRDSTYATYQSIIHTQLTSHMGNMKLKEITPESIDKMLQKMFDEGAANGSVQTTQRVLNVALEHARKYHYIPSNPARDTLTKFGKPTKTPPPYSMEEFTELMQKVKGTKWEMRIMLAGMYGLRIGEILGLRFCNVDMENGYFTVKEQLPLRLNKSKKYSKQWLTRKTDRKEHCRSLTSQGDILKININCIRHRKNLRKSTNFRFMITDL